MIRAAYRSLAQRFHPDKNQYSGAEERFKRIQAAYETLSDAHSTRRFSPSTGPRRAAKRKSRTG
ncbi:MAG: DnaJ domain-containing protein [Burkholderiales bacterium]